MLILDFVRRRALLHLRFLYGRRRVIDAPEVLFARWHSATGNFARIGTLQRVHPHFARAKYLAENGFNRSGVSADALALRNEQLAPARDSASKYLSNLRKLSLCKRIGVAAVRPSTPPWESDASCEKCALAHT
jgi:hypothetical protein